MKSIFISVSLFFSCCISVCSFAQSCGSTPIKPYIKAAGVWSQASAISISAGTQIGFGPQPVSGGAWSWSGCGTSGSSREQYITPSSSCSAKAVYTNSCGATSTQTFAVTVYPSYNTNPLAADMTGMASNAVQLASKIKLGFNLGNSMEAYGCTPASETCWGNPKISPQLIKLIKDKGFDAVRLPVSWNQYANQDNAEISAAWLDHVKQIVQYCVDNGLYVIVNIHWDGGWLEKSFTKDKQTQAGVNAKQKAFWEQIATKLRAFDEHVMFASANEPDASTADEIAALESYHQTFVDAVRSTGGKNAYRALIVQAPRTNINAAYDDWKKLPSDSASGRLMVEVHEYDPYNFAIMGKDESWGKMSYYWGKNFHSTTDPDRNSTWGEEDYLDAQFSKMKTKFVDQGVPVVIGEFAATLRTQLTGDALALHRASRAYFYQYVTQKGLENGLVPFVWDAGGGNLSEMINRTTATVDDQQLLDALLVGAGKEVSLNTAANSWLVSGGATSNGSAANMQITLNKSGSVIYNFANPINWSGATLKVVLNFDQAFVTDRNGGTAGFLQFFTYSANWGASEFKCWTANQTLVAGRDTEFTCSAFGLQKAVALGIQFPGAAGKVTIKKASINLVR